MAVIELESRAAVAVFLPSPNLAGYFPISENNCRSSDREYLFLERLHRCALVAQLVHFLEIGDLLSALGRRALCPCKISVANPWLKSHRIQTSRKLAA